jgi:hypothetical protein
MSAHIAVIPEPRQHCQHNDQRLTSLKAAG